MGPLLIRRQVEINGWSWHWRGKACLGRCQCASHGLRRAKRQCGECERWIRSPAGWAYAGTEKVEIWVPMAAAERINYRIRCRIARATGAHGMARCG
jgi:hypothetical protein